MYVQFCRGVLCLQQCLYFASEHLYFQESAGKLEGARELLLRL